MGSKLDQALSLVAALQGTEISLELVDKIINTLHLKLLRIASFVLQFDG